MTLISFVHFQGGIPHSPKQFDPVLKSSTIKKRNFISTDSDRAVLYSDDDPLLNSWQRQTGASDQVDESAFSSSSLRGRSGLVQRLLGEDSAHKDASPLDQSSAHAGRLLMGVRSAQDEYAWFLLVVRWVQEVRPETRCFSDSRVESLIDKHGLQRAGKDQSTDYHYTDSE